MHEFSNQNTMAPVLCSGKEINVPFNKMAFAFQLSDVIVRARGGKTTWARDGTADTIYCTSCQGLRVPFGLAKFDKNTPATRMNFEVRLDDEDVLPFLTDSTRWPSNMLRNMPSDDSIAP